MKNYLAVYKGSPAAMSRWDALPENERHARMSQGVAAWRAWAEKNAPSITVMGGPLSRTKLVSSAGIADIRNHLTGFTVVSAESQDAAAQMFLNHPHFTIFPGEGVEVMEVMPIPSL